MPLDRLVQRPAVVLKFFVRLEDDGDAEDDDAQSEDKPFQPIPPDQAKRLTQLNAKLATARAQHDSAAQSALKKEITQHQKAIDAAKSGQQAPVGARDDLFTLSDLVVVPTDASIELNGFRQADKLTAEFPFSDLPLTSRIVRSCLVEAYSGTVPAGAFASPDDWWLPSQEVQIMFRGYVDEWKTEHKEGGATVRVEARSMEAILIDQKINKLAPIFQVGRIEDADDPKKVRILDNELITHYLNRFFSALPNVSGALGGDQLRAVFDKRGKEPSIDRKLFLKVLQTAKSQNQAQGVPGGQPPAEPLPVPELPALPPEPGTAEGTGVARVQQPHPAFDTSAWDIVVMACEMVGCMPVYDPAADPDNIIVRLPQTVYDDEAQSITPADGFSRQVTNPDTGAVQKTPFRLMVWGRNIREMETSRKLGRIKAPAVEVVSINNDAGPKNRVLRARFPDTKRATRVGAKSPKGGKVDEVITQVVYGIRDLEQLRQIAVGLYHRRARHETSVHIKTDSMTSYQDPKLPFQGDPDLLRLRPGSALRVLVATPARDGNDGLHLTPLSDAFGQDEGQIRSFLTDQFSRRSRPVDEPGHDAALAAVAERIGNAVRQQRSRNLYYVRTINHKFERDNGWSAEMEVVTFARVTADPARMSQKDKTTNDARKNPAATRKARAAKTETQVAADRAASVVKRRPL